MSRNRPNWRIYPTPHSGGLGGSGNYYMAIVADIQLRNWEQWEKELLRCSSRRSDLTQFDMKWEKRYSTTAESYLEDFPVVIR